MRPPSSIKARQRFARLLLASLCCAALPCLAAEPAPGPVDAGWILARLERPVPSRTPFLELRGSPLLEAPLRVSGEYRRPAVDVLVRVVRAPHPETTTLRDGAIEIERNGKVRRFALSRAPELAGLQAGFGALLAGDRTTLEKHYAIKATGTRNDWVLTLSPTDTALAAKLRGIVLHGQGAELRCIETQPVEGDLQRTLLASTAMAAADVADAGALAALCRGD
ncbi:MAG TPA: LolA-related protein [Xanthomonadaceae bacterium]|nr:LolA-related protein [Xanthomonadaceae bacterium]